MQRHVLWISGFADVILDEYEKETKFSIEDLYPDLCIPVSANDEENQSENESLDMTCIIKHNLF